MISVKDRQQADLEQMAFITYELTHKYKKVGDALKKATSTAEAVDIFTRQYVVPSNNPGIMTAEIAKRTATAIAINVNNNTGGNANVQTAQVAQ